MKDREDEKMNKENNGRKFKLAAVAAMTLAAAAVSHDACAADVGAGWKVGAARVNITPQKPVWMAGYGSRDHESEGVWQDVWAKALALEDKDGRVGVIVTLDICAIAAGLSNEIRDRLEREFGLKRDQIIINTSHTHSGPQTVGALDHIFTNLTEANVARIKEYTGRFKDELVALVGRALASRRPSKVLTGQGIVRFAVNRRHNKEGMLTSTSEIKGPSDHAVPVLKVVDESGNPITFTEAIQNNTELIQEVDNEWRRVVGEGVVDGAIEVDGEKFFEGATVTNVISANTIALLIEIDEPINVTQEQLDDMAASGGTASGLSTLLGDYSEVTLPENGDVDLENNIIVGE